MPSKWTRWRSLSTHEQCDTLIAVVLIPAAAVLLRLRGARRTLAAFESRRSLPAEWPVESSLSAAREAARAVVRAAKNGPYAGNCLSQSLALMWLLRTRGVPADLRLGAQMRNGDFSAHAWVEHCGAVLNDTPDVRVRFVPFTR